MSQSNPNQRKSSKFNQRTINLKDLSSPTDLFIFSLTIISQKSQFSLIYILLTCKLFFTFYIYIYDRTNNFKFSPTARHNT